jgi:hypothetical protein
MSSERGAANLAKFNEERSANILPLLTHELQLCRKRKLEFKTHGLLAAYLSDQLKVHRTTLIRNGKYKALILAYIAGQPGAVARAPDTTEDPAILQAKLAAAKLDASTLREQLRGATAKLERTKASLPEASPADSAVAFADLAAVVAAILSRFPDFLRLDFDKRELVDLSARPSERVVAGTDRIGRFCAWVEQNQALPHLQQLKRLSSSKGKPNG